MKKLLLCFVLVCLLATMPAAAQAPRSVIIDTDMGSDDWMAILYILNDPGISVKAITVTGTGLAYCDAGVQIALGLLAITEYGDVPVSCGSETPLAGDNAFPAEWRVNLEGAAALGLPEGGQPVDQDAVALLTSIISASEEPVEVLALGPLTNLASAFEATPDLIAKISMIYVMGGAVDVPGSYINDDNTTAEWNIYCDPYAARLVFESGAPITLIALDATNDVPVTPAFVAAFEAAKKSPEAEVVSRILADSKDFIESGGYFFWDPLAAAVLVNPDLVTLETREVTVVDMPGAESGRTKPVGNGPTIQLAIAPDQARFEQHFIEVLNQ